MRLTELEPAFLKILDERTYRFVGVERAEADGIQFLCPKCFARNGGPIGTHVIICWQPHVPQTHHPKPGRWRLEGAGFEDLTFVAGSSSVLLTSGCQAHFFVRAGAIIDC